MTILNSSCDTGRAVSSLTEVPGQSPPPTLQSTSCSLVIKIEGNSNTNDDCRFGPHDLSSSPPSAITGNTTQSKGTDLVLFDHLATAVAVATEGEQQRVGRGGGGGGDSSRQRQREGGRERGEGRGRTQRADRFEVVDLIRVKRTPPLHRLLLLRLNRPSPALRRRD